MTPRSIPDRRVETDSFPCEYVIDCRASVNLSGLDDEVDHSDFHRGKLPSLPRRGRGSYVRRSTTSRTHVHWFDEPELQPQRPARVSKLTSTGEASSRPKATMPIDASCYYRFEAIAEKRRWTAFPAKAERAVRVPQVAWKELFKCPSIPQEAKEKLRADQGPSSSSSSQVFKHEDQRKLEDCFRLI
ncbi:hypothetical protein BSL78_14109 [Apostichopus japonicus]|uniref:Uncharacterized protein n=1 Tax=Stichopus japonicus TaxID=307972 RepID=A0A2G8KLX0_STIJA|nr:hypothetical protein BSL78_14109 [Apostichopus japonicus]